MGIPSISSVSAMQAALVQQQIDIAMLAKANDSVKAQGEAAVALIEAAAELAASMPATGSTTGQLDVVA